MRTASRRSSLQPPPWPGGQARPKRLALSRSLIWLAAWLPALLLTLGLAVRLAVWWANRGYEPFGDEQYYYRAAVIFAQTGRYADPPTPAWLPVQRVPLLALLAGALFRLTGVTLGPVNLVLIGLSLATAWIVWRWATLLWGRAAGLWALGIAALYPTLVTHSAAFFYTETLYTFLAALALWLLARVGGPGPAPLNPPNSGGTWSGQPSGGPPGLGGWGAEPPGGWPALGRRTLLLAALTGVVIGLTALTRSSGLALLGVALLWLALSGWRRPRPTALLAALLVAGCVVTVAPWTIRNYLTYRGLLVLDTVGAYNLWRDNPLPGETPAAVIGRLSNPIEQQRVATERGLTSLLSRPDRFLAKLPDTTLYLWHLELDSFARGGGYFMDLTNRNDSFPAVLTADLAHLAVSGLALVGLALAPWRRERTPLQARLQLLLLLWIGANLGAGIVLHSEARFRIPYQPHLIVFAVLPLAAWPDLRARAHAAPWRAALAAGLVALVLAGAWSPRLRPALQMQAWITAGDLAARWSQPAAVAAYQQAAAAFPTSDRPLVILGDAHRAAGDVDAASDAYTAALALQPYNISAVAPLAHLHLQAGRADEARRVLRASGTSDADLLSWTWRHYAPPPATAIDVGSGLELGYLANVYQPERAGGADFRWTNGNGLVRLSVPAEGAARLTLRLNGTRLTGALPPARVEVVVNGRTAARLATDGSWQTHAVDLGPLDLAPGAALLVEVRSDTFVPAAVVAGNRDNRILGVALDRIALE